MTRGLEASEEALQEANAQLSEYRAQVGTLHTQPSSCMYTIKISPFASVHLPFHLPFHLHLNTGQTLTGHLPNITFTY